MTEGRTTDHPLVGRTIIAVEIYENSEGMVVLAIYLDDGTEWSATGEDWQGYTWIKKDDPKPVSQ